MCTMNKEKLKQFKPGIKMNHNLLTHNYLSLLAKRLTCICTCTGNIMYWQLVQALVFTLSC